MAETLLKPEAAIEKEHYFSTSFVLSRVLNSGVIMSIEKNDHELKGLEKVIAKLTNTKYVSLFNSFTGAVHGALWGQDFDYGSTARLDQASEQERKFTKWLGVNLVSDPLAEQAYTLISVDGNNLHLLDQTVRASADLSPVFVLDFTGLGFGPVAAIAANDEQIWKKAERLKIFGAYDLQTMWTQEESAPELQPAIQFNYRLSPLVAACVKISLLRRKKSS
ncbi:degT/DnrJ/EryC1/StrS aminotransferase family protein [Paenibacillus swuensis]|uniref:DegT/DnrJ/EryC1/StrS aminotransferase family protein n=1 Tax=Paenibacillus swuensis TaxID=1178515 RepID=A0A172TH49_9BACL|nr:degT/DnrJ/EryC1/StrS aminotransferase [Paenibacillus swuensis]ANE46379.1 degT/DnrJ/EryC1/StrS aminotransferase family protein [Paenibacillus swuensis]